MDPYRIFVSYAHEDRPLAERVVSALRAIGLVPMWDRDLLVGYGFDEQIQTFIAHAHVFLPIITPASAARGWVHQEIGYAKALNVPVLPVCQGRVPGEMLQMLHGVVLGDDPGEPAARLHPGMFDRLVRRAEEKLPPLYACARQPDDRARMMAEYAGQVRDLSAYGKVRQKGGLTSFNLPADKDDLAAWHARYGNVDRGQTHYNLLAAERGTLGEHAVAQGCKLLVDTAIDYTPLGPWVKAVRVRALTAFVDAMPAGTVELAFYESGLAQSVTVVGDWFMAESFNADVRVGYRHTNFTRHAPSIRDRVRQFDMEFDRRMKEPRNAGCGTKEGIVQALRELAAACEPAQTPPAAPG